MSDAKLFTENWAADMRWTLWGRLDLRYKAIRLREKWAMRIVWALPRWVIKWAAASAAAWAAASAAEHKKMCALILAEMKKPSWRGR